MKITALQAAYRKREAATPRDNAPSAGEIRSLGLLEGMDDKEKHIQHGNLLPRYKDNSPKGAAA
jgi:NADH dehydrogenase (ubiquinone) Fe-S protein 5